MKLISLKDIQAHLCRWVWAQHPFNDLELCPEANAKLAEKARTEGEPGGWQALNILPMRWFKTAADLEQWIVEGLHDTNVSRIWNTPRSGHTQHVAVSLGRVPDPQDDFIDVFALYRNIAASVWTETEDPPDDVVPLRTGDDESPPPVVREGFGCPQCGHRHPPDGVCLS